jgi:3',5'-cyclic AMP phosphodiesterase CpdA
MVENETEKTAEEAAPQGPQVVGAELFARAADPVQAAPPGTVLVLPGPKPVYLNKAGALAWFDLEIARSRAKVHDPEYIDEKQGAVERLTFLQEERAKLAAAKTLPPPRKAEDLAHPATPPPE